jgi:hypothetical protein
MKSSKIGCLAQIIIILLNATVGAWSVVEILSWFGKSIPLIGNVIIGLFAGEISIPVAIVGYILKVFGVF